MLLFLLCLIRSHSQFGHHHRHLTSRIKTKYAEGQTYTYRDEGIFEVQVRPEDTINVSFNKQNYRLFLFYSPDSGIQIDNINIDGTILDKSKHTQDSNGFSVDANDYSIFTFKRHENHQKSTNQRFSLRNFQKHLTQHFQNDQTYNGYSDSTLGLTLYILPRDLCPTASVYQIGGYDMSMTSRPVSSDNSMCFFGPQLGASTKYVTNFGLKTDITGINYSLKSVLYTEISKPATEVLGYSEDFTYSISESFFIKHSISPSISNKDGQPAIKAIFSRKMDTPEGTHLYDIFCTAGAVENCNQTVCSYNKMLEAYIDYSCLNFIPEDILKWIGIAIAIVLVIVLIILIGCCFCCVGCCVCAFNSSKKSESRYPGTYDQSASQSATPTVYQQQPLQQQPQGYYYMNTQELQPGQTVVYAYNQQPLQQIPPVYQQQQPLVYPQMQTPAQGKKEQQTPLLNQNNAPDYHGPSQPNA